MVSTGTLPQDIGTTFEKSFRSYLANPPPKNHFWHIRRAVVRHFYFLSPALHCAGLPLSKACKAGHFLQICFGLARFSVALLFADFLFCRMFGELSGTGSCENNSFLWRNGYIIDNVYSNNKAVVNIITSNVKFWQHNILNCKISKLKLHAKYIILA